MSTIIDRFLKDIGIPMQYRDAGDMRRKLKLYDRCFGTDYVIQFDDFAYEIATKYNNNTEAYLAEYTSIKEKAMADIQSRPAFSDFLQGKYDCAPPVWKESVYSTDNDGRDFISIDMRKANFSSLKTVGIFPEASWEEFVQKFTSNAHIINSKYIRQVILGNCSPRIQMALEKHIMSELFQYLQAPLADLFAAGRLIPVAFSNDECIFKIIADCESINAITQKVSAAVAQFSYKFGFDMFKVQTYELHCMREEVEIHNETDTLRVSSLNSANAKVLGYIRHFFVDGKLSDKWDYKCFDNVRAFLLMADALKSKDVEYLFFVNTNYGPATLQYITMPKFDRKLITADTSDSTLHTAVFL